MVTIELEEMVSEIGEVQDFAFDNEHLWLLGYLKNQATQGRLWLANWFGDTISSIPVQNPERLYTDFFGNVHLVMRDSVYQVYSDGKVPLFAYAYDRSLFFQTIGIRTGGLFSLS